MTDWARRIREGDVRALARAATAIDNRTAEGAALSRELDAFAGHARTAGITGPPGAGKSTLVDAMVRELRRRGKTVGVIAIDPTSRVTGGAILGDRIRMLRHHADPGIFIRSAGSRGAAGGVSATTADLVRLLDAAGKDWVLVETVGVGQEESGVAGITEVAVLVLVPGLGDDVQAMKAGVTEVAQVIAMNKADRPDAESAARDIEEALALGGPTGAVVVRTVATEGTGVAELLDAVERAARRETAQEKTI